MKTSNTQFHHLGAYGRAPRKGAPAWACIEGITAEGARVPSASKHVHSPMHVELLFGCSPVEAGKLATERAEKACDAKGRRLRSDGVAILGAVISYPVARHVVNSDQDAKDVYLRWRTASLEWLKKFFGEALQSVVEHVDERQLHLHYYVVPVLTDGNRLNLDVIHPGRRAKAAAAQRGDSKPLQDFAYRQGMKAFQDLYHREVSRAFGHERVGPQRRRVSRIEAVMRRDIADEWMRRRGELDMAEAEFEREAADTRAELNRWRMELRGWHRSKLAELARERTKYAAEMRSLRQSLEIERAARLTAEEERDRLGQQLIARRAS